MGFCLIGRLKSGSEAGEGEKEVSIPYEVKQITLALSTNGMTSLPYRRKNKEIEIKR